MEKLSNNLMDKIKIDYKTANTLSKLMSDYIGGEPRLNSLYKYPFSFDAFSQVIADKKSDKTNREALVEVLNEQYKDLETSKKVRDNIESLEEENTFTITTAHQPNLFTGYLFFIYKILGAISITERLNKEFPGHHFVPIYYMGGEDHDFKEINHVYLFGEKLEWQQSQGGAVGRLNTASVEPVIEKVKEKLSGMPFSEELVEMLETAYLKHKTLSEATRYMVNRLFSDYGLVILAPDHRELKKLFIPVMEDEIFSMRANPVVQKAIDQLDKMGYKVQANPRDINFFYLTEGRRDRIVKDNNKYQALDTSMSFTEAELLKEINEHPERFSPNVFFRPLYQETILPNLAYVGGGGELAYWLEQKALFDHYQVNFPMLVFRNSALLIDKNTGNKMEKTGLELQDIFQNEEDLVKDFVKKNTENTLNLEKEKAEIEDIFERIAKKAVPVDPTLEKAIEGQKTGFLKGLENIESKLLRAEKRNFETSVNQIRSVKAKLFPNQSLQERVDNFLPWHAVQGKGFIEMLKPQLDPFDKRFAVFMEIA